MSRTGELSGNFNERKPHASEPGTTKNNKSQTITDELRRPRMNRSQNSSRGWLSSRSETKGETLFRFGKSSRSQASGSYSRRHRANGSWGKPKAERRREAQRGSTSLSSSPGSLVVQADGLGAQAIFEASARRSTRSKK